MSNSTSPQPIKRSKMLENQWRVTNFANSSLPENDHSGGNDNSSITLYDIDFLKF